MIEYSRVTQKNVFFLCEYYVCMYDILQCLSILSA